MWVQLAVICLGSSLLCGFGFWNKNKSKLSQKPASREQMMEGGYALLYQLLSDEKNVSKLLIIKREDSELRDLIKDIAGRCKRASEFLEDAAKHDWSLDLKNSRLPAVEVLARKNISKEKGKQLLQAKGRSLELLLLLSQSEALSYGSQLAAVLAAAETDPQRRTFLDNLSIDLGELHDRVLKMLIQHYH